MIPDFEKNSACSNRTFRVYDKQIGDVDVVSVPYLPDNAILITELSNLSLYVQKENLRAIEKNNSGSDSVEFYLSLRADFIAENPQGAVIIEEINFVD